MSLLYLLLAAPVTQALRYDPAYAEYNLNTNQQAVSPLDYSGERNGHTYHPSPDNWRFPFYTVMLDKWVNGDPSNDNANGTLFEQDVWSTQLRHGGDIQGLVDSLDYIQGMGIKGVYIAGSPFINQPWGADAYSPIDLTLLDAHFGNIKLWQQAIDDIHARGMYVVMDNTMATLGDLIGFDGHLNDSAPFKADEYKVSYKTDRQYHDFAFGNDYNDACEYPRFWNEKGFPIDDAERDQFKGCYDSDFDQYGDTEAFGVHPDYQRQLTKFASVQDRLRDWVPSVRQRLENFSCMVITMLDIDGFRFDKAAQVTVDAQGNFSAAMRDCAAKVGKENFFLPGELTPGNTLSSIYYGRGRQPDRQPEDLPTAMNLTGKQDEDKFFLREKGQNALDSAAFHYSVYHYLTRFLGMSGNLEAGYDLPLDWVNATNQMILTNDMVNPNSGKFDPRHMYGVTNQDNFRWPAITQGVERELLGFFITTLFLPGIPLVYYGQEQNLYVMDSTADNYIFGRQPMSPAPAWKMHGCYSLGSSQYIDWPIDQGRRGCEDDGVARDHRDPSHPTRNILKAMYAMRENYDTLSEGWLVQQLSNQTDLTVLHGSTTPTERGIWSVARAFFPTVQGQFASDPVWFVYHNRDSETNYSFDCSKNETAFFSPFDAKDELKNLFYPYDEIELESSPKSFGFDGSEKTSGCLSEISMAPFEYRAYVKKADWKEAPPMITKFTPGHDISVDSADAKGAFDVSLSFSREMDCDGVTESITISSLIEGDAGNAEIDNATVKCTTLSDDEKPPYIGAIGSKWRWSATLQNVQDGVHSIIVKNAATEAGKDSTNSTDKFLLRVGSVGNPVVWPMTANYSTSLFTKSGSDFFVNHNAAGASSWRYSTNWGSSWSDWQPYIGGRQQIKELPWEGTSAQAWSNDHVMVQYHSSPLGSSSIIQQGDVSPNSGSRLSRRDSTASTSRFPHLFVMGGFNQFGFDEGIQNKMSVKGEGDWEMHLMDEWPSQIQLNVWGINSDGQPDHTYILGDVDNDGIADRIAPTALTPNFFNISSPPPGSALSYKLRFNDNTLKFVTEPQGNWWLQIILFILLSLLPVVGGLFAIWTFMGSFYKVKVNKIGFKRRGRSPFGRAANRLSNLSFEDFRKPRDSNSMEMSNVGAGAVAIKRRTVLIATMEYNIDDWNIKIKIGGLGVMAQLMGKALEHQDLIWVVPCVSGIEYPIDQRAASFFPVIMGKEYEVEAQYHRVNNITYVLLDAPIFRKQSKADPYPPRMDDMESAIYYSAWNYCIAETMRRFPVDLYHINDYHGAAAPLYLLPERTIPCALSLHNAEFQGMWAMRTPEENKEVCSVFNLDPEIVKEYVQFGSVFNLLHAGASYLRVHQKGFGAVGVSKKYGDRSYARYPIFWGLSKIGQLPNPDPSDTAYWNSNELDNNTKPTVDEESESRRGALRKQAQEWAGLEVDPTAELFVFVGRWSLQKGVDLIADIFPSILEKYPKTQLICVGPVIDLYGKFAALKLARLMEKYPKRVYSKPEFTALPPYIFSGAEFALIPSRDEPFGLVAVEFGRKGALGVGARVGGLGQMPGFWYTIESTTPRHLLHQFRGAIVSALDCKTKDRVQMRAWSAKQRFPVAQWLQDLEKLQSEAIRLHNREARKSKRITSGPLLTVPSNINLEAANERLFDDTEPTPPPSAFVSRSVSPRGPRASSLSLPYFATRVEPPGRAPSISSRESRSRSPSQPSPPPQINQPELDATGRLLPPNPFYAAEDSENHSSSDSLATMATAVNRAGDSNPRQDAYRDLVGEGPYHDPPRDSVDTFAFRMMAPDSTTQSHLAANPSSLTVSRGFTNHRNSSRLSVIDVVGERTDYKLQKVDPFFNDSTGEYYRDFEQKLAGLSVKNSENELCIEDYLTKSEREWFKRFKEAKLGRSRSPSASPLPSSGLSRSRHSRSVSYNSIAPSDEDDGDEFDTRISDPDRDDEFLLGSGYKPPKGLKKLLQIRLGDWPIYSFLLALGQILSANSYQIVLLTGEVSQTATKLYMVAGTYGITSVLWWFIYRRFQSLYTLSLPWFFYGLAFLLVGISPFVPADSSRDVVRSLATCLYAAGASTGSIFFAVNFGDEGGSPISTWIFRACVIQGIQQLYVVALWYWASVLNGQGGHGPASGTIASSAVPVVLVITVPVAILMWLVGIVLFVGLPDYYRQSPDYIPSFYKSLMRRHVVPWFFLAVVVQNYWLSAPYGRNWQFLFSSKYIPGWSAVLLAIGFFVVVWALLLWVFSKFSLSHPWIVPMFSVGLGAPRWAQMLWGTSGVGLYLPWLGSAVASAVVSRMLWLWLGVLDTIQGVGVGMVLLLTLTRQHVAATLIGAQVLGSIATILARATAPDKLGPGDVFPDFSEGIMPGISKAWFWVALIMQLIIPFGYFKFFRKEQVAKP